MRAISDIVTPILLQISLYLNCHIYIPIVDEFLAAVTEQNRTKFALPHSSLINIPISINKCRDMKCNVRLMQYAY